MKDYECYFFDLYFTLIFPKYDEIIENNEFGFLGIDSSEWEKYANIQYNNRAIGKIKEPLKMVEDIVRLFEPNIEQENVEKITELRKKRYKKANISVQPPILETIISLNEAGKKLVLVSNADIIDKMYWPESPLFQYFHASIFSFDVGCLKPNVEIYKKGIEAVGADITKSVFIGDGAHHELSGAKKVGMDSILTTEIIYGTWPDMISSLSEDADYIINSLKELVS